MNTISEFKDELKSLADTEQAKVLQRFFKTGKGEYGEGDVFLGIKVPVQRKVAKKFKNLSLDDIRELLRSEMHEYRMTALFVLVGRFEKSSSTGRDELYRFYLNNLKGVNNWDLVDLTAPKIVGAYLLDKPRYVLYELVTSENLWEKRIAILSTFTFIRNGEFDYTLKIAELLMSDGHDLIHKALGWMLREVGKRDQSVAEAFIKKHISSMPRTMLRYAIERFPEPLRKSYLNKK